jgi:hypothetical protein
MPGLIPGMGKRTGFPAVAAALAVLGFAVAGAVAHGASSHQPGCSSSDYDSSRDTTTIVYQGLTYYCRSATVSATTATIATESTSRSTTTRSTRGTRLAWRFAYSNRTDQNLATTYGYNLIDVSTKSEADATPAGARGQLWLYDYDNNTCSWEKDDTYIRNMVSSVANDPKVAGFYFSNEPDPFACPNAPQQHKHRNALIKSLAPTEYTLIGIDANWRQHFDNYGTMWKGTADFVNYNPYICYVGKPCDFAWEDHVLQVAQSVGQPFFVALQAFREGTEWRWPTAAEERKMLQKLCGTGAQGYLTFSWNWQNDPLRNHPGVLAQIHKFNVNGCAAKLVLPDRTITPGVFNRAVRQNTIRKTICKSGWTKKVRPPVSYMNALKAQQMVQYGETGSPSAYVEDHLIPLELGGAPKNPKNLWPEPHSQSKLSNPLEMQLKQKVCNGVMTLKEARAAIRRFKNTQG